MAGRRPPLPFNVQLERRREQSRRCHRKRRAKLREQLLTHHQKSPTATSSTSSSPSSSHSSSGNDETYRTKGTESPPSSVGLRRDSVPTVCQESAQRHPQTPFTQAETIFSDPALLRYLHICLQVPASSRRGRALKFDFSLIRLMHFNADVLGLDRRQVDDCDAVSIVPSSFSHFKSRSHASGDPFRVQPLQEEVGTDASTTMPLQMFQSSRTHCLQWSSAPLHLIPGENQSTVPHHAFIDVGIPWPSLRENICQFLRLELIDEDHLGGDVFHLGNLFGGDPCFQLVRPNPLDPEAWEISQEFHSKWWFLFIGQAFEIVLATNRSRRRRGLPCLTSPQREKATESFAPSPTRMLHSKTGWISQQDFHTSFS
ncbi:hypothetical protein IE53DRAFT_371951 [Violaceomyces palustris]|uniref:Uncharacterized protein n=1 Tax=Violaceomyces palustris TaxID=1673888 RepID=A0ACD0NM32_9BASI|nr:hypothetical protein IE53DRAFT_371951 [Violaceomyces palustris]